MRSTPTRVERNRRKSVHDPAARVLAQPPRHAEVPHRASAILCDQQVRDGAPTDRDLLRTAVQRGRIAVLPAREPPERGPHAGRGRRPRAVVLAGIELAVVVAHEARRRGRAARRGAAVVAGPGAAVGRAAGAGFAAGRAVVPLPLSPLPVEPPCAPEPPPLVSEPPGSRRWCRSRCRFRRCRSSRRLTRRARSGRRRSCRSRRGLALLLPDSPLVPEPLPDESPCAPALPPAAPLPLASFVPLPFAPPADSPSEPVASFVPLPFFGAVAGAARLRLLVALRGRGVRLRGCLDFALRRDVRLVAAVVRAGGGRAHDRDGEAREDEQRRGEHARDADAAGARRSW